MMTTKTANRRIKVKRSPAKRRRLTKPLAAERIKTLINSAVQTRTEMERLEAIYDNDRAEILRLNNTFFKGEFSEIVQGIRYWATTVTPSTRAVADTLLDAVEPAVAASISRRVVDEDALLEAVANGLISPELVEKITRREIDQAKAKSFIDKVIAEDVAAPYIIETPKKPYARFDRS